MRLFGTDGIRGEPWNEPLTKENIIRLGYVLGKRFEKILIIRDTRESGREIEDYLCEGIIHGGGKPYSAGILPTPSLSYLVPKHHYSLGISISASHNPFMDNGIKLVNSRGRKLSIKEELEIEEETLSLTYLTLSRGNGREKVNLKDDYIEFLTSLGKDLSGKKIILDSASGAAFGISKEVFSNLGAKAKEISPKPDGRNINLTGSEKTGEVTWKTKRAKAFIGFAYDGDADRCLWIDEDGEVLTGDHTLYFIARDYCERKREWNKKVVGTVMSNLALEEALSELGVKFERAPVGDRFVFQTMVKTKAILGGEQSGHTIFREILPTGDGILTSVLIASLLTERGEKPSLWRENLRLYPQKTINIPVKTKKPLEKLDGFREKVEKLKEKYKDTYLLIRYSGTQPLLRITIQSKDKEKMEEFSKKLRKTIQEILKKENILEE